MAKRIDAVHGETHIKSSWLRPPEAFLPLAFLAPEKSNFPLRNLVPFPLERRNGMDWVTRMNRAPDYIEAHLADEMDYSEIAKAALCSLYHFPRMSPAVTGMTLSEYIRRRRLTQAAYDLADAPIAECLYPPDHEPDSELWVPVVPARKE